jgi:hypothetical protein
VVIGFVDASIGLLLRQYEKRLATCRNTGMQIDGEK